MSFARDERIALCDLLDETGPEAPTLCEGWRTLDLAAHLVLREHRPDAALERSRSGIEGDFAHFYAGDVGNGIPGARDTRKRHAQIARARLGRSGLNKRGKA